MSRLQMLDKIRITLGHFKVDELRKNVSPCFAKLKWETVLQELKNEKLPLSMKNFKIIIMKSLKNEITEYLQTIYLRLAVVDIALHNKRKLWISYEMHGCRNNAVNLENLHKNIRQGCRFSGIECAVQSFKHDEIVWITLFEKKSKRKSRGLIWSSPTYYAYFLESSYLFCNNNTKDSLLKPIVHALQHEGAKIISLVGHDVKSLYSLLKRKEYNLSRQTPDYVVSEPKDIGEGVDYTLIKSRERFSKSCFDNNPVLETVTFMSEGVLQGLPNEPNNEELKMNCSLKFSSPNVFLSFKELMLNNIINPENCSDDVKHLLHSGINIIKRRV